MESFTTCPIYMQGNSSQAMRSNKQKYLLLPGIEPLLSRSSQYTVRKYMTAIPSDLSNSTFHLQVSPMVRNEFNLLDGAFKEPGVELAVLVIESTVPCSSYQQLTIG
jgi:hypothetical protein